MKFVCDVFPRSIRSHSLFPIRCNAGRLCVQTIPNGSGIRAIRNPSLFPIWCNAGGLCMQSIPNRSGIWTSRGYWTSNDGIRATVAALAASDVSRGDRTILPTSTCRERWSWFLFLLQVRICNDHLFWMILCNTSFVWGRSGFLQNCMLLCHDHTSFSRWILQRYGMKYNYEIPHP